MQKKHYNFEIERAERDTEHNKTWKRMRLWGLKPSPTTPTSYNAIASTTLVCTTEEYSDHYLIGGMRGGDQRVWASVLLTYLHDFENSKGEGFDQAIVDFMESIETGDLAYIAELANIDFDNFLKLCAKKLNTRNKYDYYCIKAPFGDNLGVIAGLISSPFFTD